MVGKVQGWVQKTPTSGEWKPVWNCSAVGLRLLPFLSSPPFKRMEGPTWDRDTADQYPVFPRKEVIQPHLPVRLPCYDFTPITDPTLDACPPLGLAQRLQVLPTFVV